MEDFFGQELNIGDIVAVEAKNYRHLTEAEIVEFTPKKVRVQYLNTWNYGKDGRLQQLLTYPLTLIKKPT